MLQDQVISVNFGEGTDTKTDPKLTVPGSLIRLENGVFTNAKRVSKRSGYDAMTLNKLGGGTLSSPRGLKSYQSELVAADAGRLYSYSSQLGVWVDKGKYKSLKVTNTYMSRSAYLQSYASAAVAGNYAVYAWTANGSAYAKVVDVTTGTVLLQETSLGGTSSVTLAATLGSSTLGVFYTDTSRNLFLKILSISSGGVSFGSPITIASTLTKDGGSLGTDIPYYDVATTSTGAVVCWVTGATWSGTPAGILAKTIDTTGATLNTGTVDVFGRDALVRAFVGSNGNIWFYWTDDTAPNNCPIYYSVFSSTLSSVLVRTTIATGVNVPVKITALPTSATTQTVYYQTTVFSSAPHIFAANVNSSGTAPSASQVLSGVIIVSDPFTVSSTNYMTVGFQSASLTQSTAFVLDLADYGVVAKAFAGKWNDSPARSIKTIAYSSSLIGIPCLVTTQLDSTSSVIISQVGSALAIIDFDHQDRNQAIVAQNLQIWNGGVLTMYDGTQAVELGFHLFPEAPLASDSGAGTGPGAGTYNYFAVYRWFDAQGNMHQSAPSPARSFTMASGNAITVLVNYLYLTQKTNSNSPVQILIYRTTSAGSIPYLVTAVTNPPINNTLGDYYTFTDTVSNSALIGNEMLYSNPLIAGSVVENIAPPPAMLMTTHNNRVHVIDSESGNLWSSKSLQDGVGTSFSDLFVQSVDARGGNVTAIASLDDKFVAFKQDIFFVQSGDGPNDTGSGSTLTNFQLVPSDAGCSQSKGIVLLPVGLMFKSSKGIYLLDRSLNASYIGAPVEAYNSQTVTSAVMIKDKSQVRFLTDSGYTLVYDYLFNKWGTFTNHQGYAADNWGSTYVYARVGGAIYQENSSTYLDAGTAYALKAQTSWLKLQAIQGFQRVRRVALLGDYTGGSGHGVQISAAYDYGTTFSTPIQYLPSGSSGILQYRERLPQQKCESISLLIEEVTTGVSGEFIDFTDLTFEAGLKRGVNKLPATQSAG